MGSSSVSNLDALQFRGHLFSLQKKKKNYSRRMPLFSPVTPPGVRNFFILQSDFLFPSLRFSTESYHLPKKPMKMLCFVGCIGLNGKTFFEAGMTKLCTMQASFNFEHQVGMGRFGSSREWIGNWFCVGPAGTQSLKKFGWGGKHRDPRPSGAWHPGTTLAQ